MTHVNIDWVSTLLFLAAYGFSSIPAVPPRVGNAALSLACVAIVIYRLRTGTGTAGINLLFVGIAAVLALYYGMRAVQSPGRRRPPADDDD